MKLKTCLILGFSLLVGNLFAKWQTVDTNGVKTIHNLKCRSGNCYFLGEQQSKTVLYRYNNGSKFVLVKTFGHNKFKKLEVGENGRTMWVAGLDGRLGISQDYGRNWVWHNFRFNDEITDLSLHSEQEGWFLTATKVHWNNGERWYMRRLPFTGNYRLLAIQAVGEGKALMLLSQSNQAGSSKAYVYGTEDGGRHWTQLYQRDRTVFHYEIDKERFCVAPDICRAWFSMGNGYLSTEDEGLNWEVVTEGAASGIYGSVRGVSFLNSQHGWLVGGNIYRTNNGGANWEKIDKQHNTYLDAAKALEVPNAYSVYVLTNPSGTFGNLIFRYTDY